MRLLGDRVLVKPIIQEKTEGGILLVSGSPTVQATVVLVGEGYLEKNGVVNKPQVSIGDRIYFSYPAISLLTKMKYKGDECLLISNNDIICIDNEQDCTL